MSFDWDDYLHLARYLLGLEGIPTQEALERCAVSRAYYAAFWKARVALEGEPGQVILKRGVHTEVIHQLSCSNMKQRKKIGVDLQRLKEAREEAEYEARQPGSTNWTRKAQDSTARSQRILSAVPEAFRPQPSRGGW